MKRILLTGSSGFVGKRYLIVSENRERTVPVSVNHTKMPCNDDFADVDTIVHLGGLAHQMQQVDAERYFEANYDTTRQLADLAKTNGVTHFIFVSTIKVFGELQDSVLTELSPCLPVNDPYGESKLKAEQYLQSIQDETFTVSIVRPPLIYGPGVKGNLDKLLKLSDSPYPLPFKNINNKRTMLYLDNFIALIDRIIEKKIGGLFLAGDDRAISTEELVKKIRSLYGRRLNLFAIPGFVRNILNRVKPELSRRLFGSLEMDASASYKKIQFIPPHSIDTGIKSMVDFYLSRKK